MLKAITVVALLTVTGCTTYQGYPALIPLPSGDGAGVNSGITTGRGVSITPITVSGRSFTVVAPAR